MENARPVVNNDGGCLSQRHVDLLNEHESAKRRRSIHMLMREESMIPEYQSRNGNSAATNSIYLPHNSFGGTSTVFTGAIPGEEIVSFMLNQSARMIQRLKEALSTKRGTTDLVKAEADNIKAANFVGDTASALHFGNSLASYDRQFKLWECDGWFNIDHASQAAFNINPENVPTLSIVFVKSLSSDAHFHQVDIDLFVSTEFIMHMARCPAVRSMNPLLIYRIMNICGFKSTSTDQKFQTWYGHMNRDSEWSVAREKLVRLFNVMHVGALFQRGLCMIYSNFLVNQDVNEANNNPFKLLQDYFNMELLSWKQGIQGMEAARRATEPTDANEDPGFDVNQFPIPPSVVSWVKNFSETVSAGEVQHRASSSRIQAQQLDLYYANLVHGASVKVPLSEIWCPNNEMEHTDRDTDAFFKIMWNSLKDVLEQVVTDGGSGNVPSAASAANGGADIYDKLIKSIRGIKASKKVMKEIWEASKDYRISDRVHMTEVQVLQRLKVDGVFRWIDREWTGGFMNGPGEGGQSQRMQNAHICFYMRR
jgi:hypothetical protein